MSATAPLQASTTVAVALMATSARRAQHPASGHLLIPPPPGCLLPDGVPLDGLLGALSGLVGSVSEWWTPSGTGHLPLPASIHVDVQVTVPITSLALPADPAGLADLAPPADPAGSGSTRLVTRGPQPGQKPGAYETTPYPKATHTLGLAPLIDAAPPF